MSDPRSTPTPAPTGRRAAATSRRPSATAVLAVVVPLVTVGALTAVSPRDAAEPTRPPSSSALTRATLVCPGGAAGAADVAVANADPDRTGTLVVGDGDDTLDLPAGQVPSVSSEDPVVVRGEDELAPGLVAGRGASAAATACPGPRPEAWFTGVGAGAEHRSVLELVNPDGGPAVADVTVHGPDGVVDVPALRGVTVRGHRAERFDLASVVPSREELAVHVRVTRGRLGSSVLDTVEEVGSDTAARDWLAAQDEPATTSYLLGLGAGRGTRVLTVANPGDSEARVELRLVAARSEFAPADVEALSVAPGAVATVDLTDVLAGEAARDAVGLRLDASGEVTAGLRTLVGDDLAHAVTGVELGTTPAGVVVPPGPKRLVLAGIPRVGSVEVSSRTADGRSLATRTVDLDQGRAARVPLPARAAYVEVAVADTTAVGVVEIGRRGLAVVPLVPLELAGRVADVAPALQ